MLLNSYFMANRLARYLEYIDYHGHPISLSYKNRTTYQTTFGGVITLLSRLGILAYFLVLVNLIVNRQKTVSNKSI